MPNLAQEDVSIDADIIAAMLSRIYRGKYGNDGTKALDLRLFEATHETFNRATASGIADAVNRGVPAPSASFLELLDRNNAIFSAFRSNKFQKDVASMLLDSKGHTKSFADFKRDVAPIVGKYNGSWLRTEYATAVQRSRLATKWQQFVDEQDVFPNLEWVQSTALHPGEDHRIFWYTVRPVNDPFWSHHRPGDRWNCQCDLRQTDLPPTDIPTVPINDTKNSPAPGLDNNPGTDGVIFNDRHPYFPKNCTTCPRATIGKKLMSLVGGKKGDCYACMSPNYIVNKQLYEKYKNDPEYKEVEFNNEGGMKATSVGHNEASSGDYGKMCEKKVQNWLYNHGHSCILLPEDIIGHDNNVVTALDAIINGKVMDIKTITERPVNFESNGYRNALNSKNKQLSRYYRQTGDRENCLFLYVPNATYWDEDKLKIGWVNLNDFLRREGKTNYIEHIYVLVNDELLTYDCSNWRQ